MKAYKTIFPFTTSKEIPDDIKERLNDHVFSELKDGQTKSSGFALLTESEQFICSDGRYLFHYCEQSRKADANTVQHILNERLGKVEEEGREITLETHEELKAVAQREATKFAAIKHSGVCILFDAPAGRMVRGKHGEEMRSRPETPASCSRQPRHRAGCVDVCQPSSVAPSQ